MELSDYIEKHTTKLLDLLDVVAEVQVVPVEGDDSFEVDIQGDDLGHLIGFKGSVVNSFQSFLYFIVRREFGEGYGVRVNVNNYREKREESLQSMVKEAAVGVEKTGKSYRFGRLTPYERRYIHTYVSDTYSDLVTYSVGEGFERRLVLAKSDM